MLLFLAHRDIVYNLTKEPQSSKSYFHHWARYIHLFYADIILFV